MSIKAVTYFGNKDAWTFTAPLINDSNIGGGKKYPNETTTPISKLVWSGVGIFFIKEYTKVNVIYIY